MKPQCWDAICYLAGTTRGGDGTVTLSQSDCREMTAYVIQLTARGMADRALVKADGAPCHVPLRVLAEAAKEESDG